MATQKGVAVIWGVPAARQAGAGFTTTGSRFSPEAETKRIKNADGESKTHVTWDKTEVLELEVFPSGGSPGTLPEIGDTVTVDSEDWLFEGGEEASANESEQKMTFRLRRFPGNITL